jgi:uncharacterized repeat protein (TIGR01451 family)
VLSLATAAIALAGLGPSSAAAAAPGPAWAISSVALPTNFTQADTEACGESDSTDVQCDGYVVYVTNVGTEASAGTLTVTDRLPPGLLFEAEGSSESSTGGNSGIGCTRVPGATVTCTDSQSIPPGGVLGIPIEVQVTPQAGSLVTNVAEVEGGGGARAVTSEPATMPNAVNGAPPAFGAEDFGVGAFGPGGEPDDVAGDHPSTISTTINYTTLLNPIPAAGFRATSGFQPVQEPKTEIVDLPFGLVGDPLAAAQCPESRLRNTESNPEHPCPADSVVGEATVAEGNDGIGGHNVKIFNMVPEAGYPAMFGFEFAAALFYLRARVLPTAAGYVLSVSVPDLDRSSTVKITGATITFFGDPSERDGGGNGQAMFTNADACGSGPLEARLEMDSWVDPEHWVSAEAPFYQASSTQAVTGCGGLQFEPSIGVTPEESTADTPSGYEVDLKVPQTPNVPGTAATPDLKSAVIALPEGVAISPSAANGLTACQASGPEGIELGNNDLSAADKLASERGVKTGEIVQEGEELGEDGLVHASKGHCPLASQVGEVEVVTPLLKEPLEGHLYVAEPECGDTGQEPCTATDASNGKLFGIYLEVAGSGVIVKLKGKVFVNPETGQITTSFDEAPQLPFSELKLKLNGGQRAPLANPQTCGSVTATSDLTPWSTPVTPDATPFSSFPVTGCENKFNPSFTAGMSATLHAGSYSPFTLSFSRRDGEHDLSGLTVDMPQGLLGKIAGVPLCPEAAANIGTCSAASKVGTATAGAGAGSEPFYQSGPVYLTGPYKGAPFGLSVVVPANAGPYHLGNIVVRAAIHINPTTAAVTVVSNPLPQMVDGVPLRVQTVNVTVGEGNDFTFNPTSCAAKTINAAISSAQGATANVSAPFASTGCAALPFKPVLSASTVGKASKAGGASLDVKIASGVGQANVAKVDLQLPKQLSSRLTTLQKACTEAQFAANPAGCPVASDIGSAIVHTPLLNGPLAGPVFLVSHGGAAFPDVEMILQGEGVQLVLDGKTQIKKGITYSHFESVPDAPFSSFETKLPTGKFSIFAANVPAKDDYNLCGQSLSMPIEIVGQNGAVVKQTTKVGVTGCPKAKKATKKKKKVSKATKRGK